VWRRKQAQDKKMFREEGEEKGRRKKTKVKRIRTSKEKKNERDTTKREVGKEEKI